MIKLLPPSLQNQIAAGEVVERPASIIKELIENAIDANADTIEISIKNGGIELIRVIDNGKGMTKDDAKIALQRYATSKMYTVDDLFTLNSFGFRGEALASIASVSKFTLRTKQKSDEYGIEIVNSEDPVGYPMANGTQMIAENLFWNVPARRKFLKSPTTETKEITKMIEFFALSHPSITFIFENNGKEIFLYSAKKEPNALEKRCSDVLGKSIVESFLPLHYEGEDISLEGFCTHSNFHRSTRDRQFFFVNDRILSFDKIFSGAINQAYRTLLPNGKFPGCVIKLTLPPEMVDCNVHPRKTEVKFHDSSRIFNLLKGAIQSALANNNTHKTSTGFVSHDVSSNQNNQFNNRGAYNNTSSISSSTGNTQKSYPSHSYLSSPKSSSSYSLFPDLPESNEKYEMPKDEWKVVGQIRKSFIVVEESEGVRIVDQHAAHERVRLETFQKNKTGKSIQSQPLLTPEVFSFSASEKQSLMGKQEELSEIGFDIQDFGGNDISLNALPADSIHIDAQKLIHALLDDTDNFDSQYSQSLESFSDRAISYTACRGAKKFGDELNQIEMEALIRDWKKCAHPESCAHGRPVSIFYPYKELENECGRY